MAKHSREEHRSSLCITIIEARGLRPQHGRSSLSCCAHGSPCTDSTVKHSCFRLADLLNYASRGNCKCSMFVHAQMVDNEIAFAVSLHLCVGVAVAFQANDLPNPLVEVSTPGRPQHLSWTKHTLNPKFPATEAMMYDKLPSDTIITFKLFDNKGTLTKRRRRQLLGSNSVCCTHFTGEDPLYVWLPMHQPSTRHRRRKAGLLPPPGHVPDLQASLLLPSNLFCLHRIQQYVAFICASCTALLTSPAALCLCCMFFTVFLYDAQLHICCIGVQQVKILQHIAQSRK